MEQTEDNKEDHNILAKLPGEKVIIDKKIKNLLGEFVSHVFDHRVGKVVKTGQFLGRMEAEKYINICLDP